MKKIYYKVAVAAYCLLPLLVYSQRCISFDTSLSSDYAYNYELFVLSLGDINADGANEYLFQVDGSTGNYLLTGKGRQITITPFGLFNSAIAAGDVNRDNFDDVIAISYDQFTVHLGSASGSLTNTFGSITAAELLPANLRYHRFISVLAAGDINADGYHDLIVTAGAYSMDNEPEFYHQLSVLYGSSGSFMHNPNQDLVLRGFGFNSLRYVGDLNGDGFRDYFIESRQANRIGLIFWGTSNVIDTSNYSEVINSRTHQLNDIVLLGDVNGDERDDFILSFQGFSYPGSPYYADLYIGSRDSVLIASEWAPPSPSQPNYPLEFGRLVRPLGDFNGDGLNDFIISGHGRGAARIYYGKEGSLPSNNGDLLFDETLPIVADMGDLDGDQFMDALGLTGIDERMEGEARLAILYGKPDSTLSTYSCSLKNQPFVTIGGERSNAAGDVNGDGFDDIITGDSWDEEIEEPIGNIVLYYGNNVPFTNSWSVQSEIEEYFGENVSGLGDINGDGLDDFAAVSEYNQVPFFGRVYIYLGSQELPDKDADIIIQGSIENYLAFNKPNAGDVNRDGFDDVLLTGHKARSIIYLGTSSGLDTTQWWTSLFESIPAGDINKDGYYDLAINRNNSIFIAYGSVNGPVDTSHLGIQGSALQSIGDINGDGYSDLLVKDGPQYLIYLGSVNGLIHHNWSFSNIKAITKAGDFNADGFDDIVLIKDYYFPDSTLQGKIAVFFGSSRGLNAEPGWLAGDLYGSDYYRLSFAGDVNGDGADDFVAGNHLFLGFVSDRRKCPGLVTLETDAGKCFATPSALDPIVLPGERIENFSFIVSGATQIKSTGSVNGHPLNKGTNYIRYFLTNNPADSCSFYVTVIDKEAPVIQYKDTLSACYNADGSISIDYVATDNCGIDSTWYVLHGYYPDGSVEGPYGYKAHSITLLARDVSGNQRAIDGWVRVGNKPRLSIPNTYVINAAQSAPNTIYIGYANNTIRLSAYLQGGIPPFKYKWSTGDTTRYLRVRHDSPGSFAYTVTVTDRKGCSISATRVVKAIDITCANPLKDFVRTYFPWLLAEPWIQELIKSTASLKLCINGKTSCNLPGEIKAKISGGAVLGACAEEVLTQRTQRPVLESSTILFTEVVPNPSGHAFTVRMKEPLASRIDAYQVRVFTIDGKLVHSRSNIWTTTYTFGSELPPGTYICEIINDTQKNRLIILKR